MSHSEETRCSHGSARPRRARGPAGIAILGVVFASLLAWSTLKPGVAGGQPTLRIEDDGQVAGAAITLRGSGFGVGENVNLTVTHADGGAEAGMGHESWTVIAPDGTFATTWSISPADTRGDRFVATAVGGLSGATHPVNFGRMVVVATDKFDYAPGETASIVGAGFRAGEDVTLQVIHTRGATDGGAGHDPWTVTADAAGTISAAWYVNPDDSEGAEFLIHARGARSGLAAAWAFMDAVCQNPPPPDPIVPLDMPGVACPANLNSCTANDVVTAVIAATPVDGDVCGSATDTLTLDFTVQFATTANQRYDLGFYISEDGLGIPGHTISGCAGSAPQVGDGDGNADPADCDSDLFLDLDPTGHKAGDPDTCGDLQNNAGPVRMTFRATVACDHLDASHNLLVPSCRVWEQNANHDTACTSLAQAGTGSKCDCTDLSFAGVLDPCVTAFCDDSNACTADSCDSSTGRAVCNHDPVSNGTSCDDANACTTGETCQGGTCAGGTAPDCDDHNVCTDDRCDATAGCSHTDNTAPCNDGNFCNGTDTCSAGQCSHSGDPCGAGQVCDGNDGVCVECLSNGDCHDGGRPFCDSGHECVQCLTDSNCDDHNACTGTETCVGNTCHAGTPLSCDDHNGCTDDRCDATAGCSHTDNTAPCNDGNFCNGTDTCSAGQCSHSGDPCGGGQVCDGNDGVCVECLSNGDCHDGGRPFCDSGHECVQCLTDANCDDHNACTGAETCVANTCHAGTPLSCDDHNVCTDDKCDATAGCSHTDNTAPCNDGNFCNGTDTCSAGQCSHSGDPCGAGQVCDGNDGVCVECLSNGDCHDGGRPFCDSGHECVQCLTDSNCDDHNACTGAETCVGNTCHAGTPLSCDDHNVCTDDRCDATAGCSHTDNTAPCNDGNFCNGTDTCSAGQCSHSGDPCGAGQVCDGNDGVCVECLSNGDCHDGGRPFCDSGHECVQCLTDSNCDDHNACTGTETCVGNTCHAGTPLSCDDHNGCTDDRCDATAGCSHTDNTAPCNDGNFCNGTDTCSAGQCSHSGDPCGGGQVCDGNDGVCVECLSNGDCHDGGRPFCDSGHECVQCLTDANCDDHNACTGAETCVANTCHAGTPLSCDDHNVCTDDKCDATAGCSHTDNTAPCNDGNFCNGTDTCSAGQCSHSGDPCGAGQVCDGNDGVCVECLSNGDCHDGGRPFCDSGHECVQCLTDSNCDDHNACTGAETCVGNTCHAGTPLSCDDHNVCTDDRCDATAGCSHTDNTAPCNDGNFCNGTDTCSAGQCSHSGDPCGAGQVCDGNDGVCVECLSNGDCHDGGRPFCDSGHECVQCLTDSNCDDHNACTGTETCQAGLCAPGQAPNCNDNNPCTTDACDTASGCTHTTVSGGQDGSCQTVTDTSFCPLPPDPTCGAGTFRLIDLQNPTAGPSGSIVRNDYLLNASNPGQWYYNVFYTGTPGSSFSLTIDVPWPFITQGAVPIQVHDGTGLSGGCFAPNPSLPGFTITTDGGNVSAGGSAVILLNDYKMQNLGNTTAVYVSGSVPSTGMAYVTIHLDYGVKKLSGWQQAPDFTTLQGPDINLDGSIDGLGDGPIYIKGGTPACTAGQEYTFDFNGGGPTLGSTVYSINTFKKNPGINGLLLKSSGSGKANVRVEFWGPTGKLIASTTTDADGFYMFSYKATGKPSTYTIKVPALGLQKSTPLKANGYALVTFENVP